MTVATQTPQTLSTKVPTSFCTKLVSKEGNTEYPLKAMHICEETFAPLEVAYDYDLMRRHVTRETIEACITHSVRADTPVPFESVLPGLGTAPIQACQA